jgi:hypothetical protein
MYLVVTQCLAFITASLAVLGEKLGGRPTNQSAGVLGIMLRASFLGSSGVHPMLLMASERLLHTWIAHIKCTCGICGLAQEVYVSCVSGFSPAGCTSIRIAVTLGYE